nr:uncharacterized protein LOC113815915 isoform X2 [Penaeus vannamei]
MARHLAYLRYRDLLPLRCLCKIVNLWAQLTRKQLIICVVLAVSCVAAIAVGLGLGLPRQSSEPLAKQESKAPLAAAKPAPPEPRASLNHGETAMRHHMGRLQNLLRQRPSSENLTRLQLALMGPHVRRLPQTY